MELIYLDWLSSHYLSYMEPAQIEFVAEKESVSILPNFTEDKLYLISVSSNSDYSTKDININLLISVIYTLIIRFCFYIIIIGDDVQYRFR
jgi:hypothetical protein